MDQLPLVLDPCCGSRMWWFDRQHPAALYGDRRQEQHILCDGRTLRIEPDQIMDFRALPFADGTFKLVAFDPPHLKVAGPKSWMAAKYGKLSEDWRNDLRQGFAECFRVLDRHGVLVFKWNEVQIPIKEILALTPHQPLFGNTSGKRAGQTHFMVFLKTPAPVCGRCHGTGYIRSGYVTPTGKHVNSEEPCVCAAPGMVEEPSSKGNDRG